MIPSRHGDVIFVLAAGGHERDVEGAALSVDKLGTTLAEVTGKAMEGKAAWPSRRSLSFRPPSSPPVSIFLCSRDPLSRQGRPGSHIRAERLTDTRPG